MGFMRWQRGQGQAIPANQDSERERFEFVSFVHDDIQKAWQQSWGQRYQPARLVIYRRGTPTGCGLADH